MDLIHHTKEVYQDFFQSAHQDGALDAKTKSSSISPLSWPCAVNLERKSNLAGARTMGITEEELAECIQLAASVGAGTIRAMARRASKKSEPEINGLSTLI